jgi:hypothetical protein
VANRGSRDAEHVGGSRINEFRNDDESPGDM